MTLQSTVGRKYTEKVIFLLATTENASNVGAWLLNIHVSLLEATSLAEFKVCGRQHLHILSFSYKVRRFGTSPKYGVYKCIYNKLLTGLPVDQHTHLPCFKKENIKHKKK